MPTSTVEQYIKTIYRLAGRYGTAEVNMKPLADAMDVTPGTATSMAKHLADRGFVQYVPRRGVRLSAEGKALALKIIRRHRLIETFLERVLNYDWSEVHLEAEELEHAVSDTFIRRIDALLGNPSTDPHGDPIPTESGVVADQPNTVLAEAPVGAAVHIHRLINDGPDFLNAMNSIDIRPGNDFLVVNNTPELGTVTIVPAAGGEPLTIGRSAAAGIIVRLDTLPEGPLR